MRFNISHILLAVTWCGIVISGLARFLTPALFDGRTHDIADTIFTKNAFDDPSWTTVSAAEIAMSPSWHPAEANPPIAARTALQIANEFRKSQLRDKNEWKWGLDWITLYPADAENNKWCWGLSYTAFPDPGGIAGRPPSVELFVLMNGQVILPESEEHRVVKEMGLLSRNAESASTTKGPLTEPADEREPE